MDMYSVFFKAKWQEKSISAQCRMWPYSSSCVHVASVISDNFHLAFCIRKGNPQYRSMRKAGERGGAELRWALSLVYNQYCIYNLKENDKRKS